MPKQKRRPADLDSQVVFSSAQPMRPDAETARADDVQPTGAAMWEKRNVANGFEGAGGTMEMKRGARLDRMGGRKEAGIA